MTKRLFAIVLAAVLAITMFTFPSFATGDVRATLNKDGTKLTLTFNPGNDVGANRVVLNFYVGENTSPVKTETVTDMTKTSYDYSTTTGGKYHAQVVYYKGSQIIDTAESGTQTIPITVTGSGMTVSYDENGIVVTWNKVTNATRYRIECTLKNGLGADPIYVENPIESSGKVSYLIRENSTISFANLGSVKVYSYVNGWNNNSPCATCTVNYTSNPGSSTGGLNVSGSVTAQIYNGNIVGTITNYSGNYVAYRIALYYGQPQPSYSYLGSSRTFSIPISNLPSNSVQISVEGTSNPAYNNYWQQIGVVNYNYGNTGSTGGNGNLNISYFNGAYVLSWPGVSGAQRYDIRYQGNGINQGYASVNGNTTYWPIPFLNSTNSFAISVTAYMSDGSIRNVGYYTSGYNMGFNPGFGGNQATGGVVTRGTNCTVTSYPNYAYVEWTSTGASDYYVMVYRDGDTTGQGQRVYNQTYIQLQISNTYDYNILVYNGNNGYAPIASANVKASATANLDNINIKRTEIKNLRVTELNSYTTSLSWDRVSGADCYVVTYGLLNGGAADEIPVYNGSTTATIPFGSNTAYQATVYAITSSGRSSEVGHVYNVPGTTANSNTGSKDYPSNFTAKSSNKRVSLSWKAADGASSYTIYYKRSTSSTWLKANKNAITKTAVNISGLSNDINYNFKVVTNTGNESGVVTIAPSASTSRTVTAKDPSTSSNDDDINLDDEDLTVTSVSSTSRGKIKITWSNVGAPSYKIYVAEGTSNSYKPCGTYTGTSATISTFGTGSSATTFKSGKTYKVRIVRTDYTGSIKDALKACPYKTVTVK